MRRKCDGSCSGSAGAAAAPGAGTFNTGAPAARCVLASRESVCGKLLQKGAFPHICTLWAGMRVCERASGLV
jgi:hypothetical protein